jgi:hypothetical protein
VIMKIKNSNIVYLLHYGGYKPFVFIFVYLFQ